VALDASTSPEELRRKAARENFPVALHVLPARLRRHLRHLYDVARVIDDLGDEAVGTVGNEKGERTEALRWFRADLATIWRGGTPRSEVLRNLAETVAACALPEQPFLDLIEANLRDQTTTVYATYDDLLRYCALSANPVGQLVLAVFGVNTPERVAQSDKICTALQIIEHCQDVAEDHRNGRLYLPLADLATFGVWRSELDAASPTPQLRELIRFEAERAEALLAEGTVLLTQLRGWARLAVAGYIAGGQAAVKALRRGGWSVLPRHPPRRRSDVLASLISLSLKRVPAAPAKRDQRARPAPPAAPSHPRSKRAEERA
jgi:squalene synthase HpnC